MAREKFRLKDQKVISYGPCQTPTLWFCVQRHKEIQNFRATEYYYVSAKINILGKEVRLHLTYINLKNMFTFYSNF